MQPQMTAHSANIQATPPPEGLVSSSTVILSFSRGKVQIELREGEEVVLGRQRGADYKLVDLTNYYASDYGVSRVHAILRYKNNRLWVEDLSSSNGTWLNGIRLAPRVPYPLDDDSELLMAAMSISVLVTGNSRAG